MSKAGDVAKGMLLFAAFGPAVGAFAVSAFLLAIPALDGTPVHGASPDALTVILGAMLFAYPLGIVPAAIAGSVCGLYRARLVDWKAFVAVGVLASATACASGIFWVAPSERLAEAIWPTLFLWGVPGFLAGVVCAYFFQPFSYRSGRPSTTADRRPDQARESG